MRAAWCSARDSRLVTDATGKPVREKKGKREGGEGGGVRRSASGVSLLLPRFACCVCGGVRAPEKGTSNVTLSALVLLLPTCRRAQRDESAREQDGASERSTLAAAHAYTLRRTGSGSHSGITPLHTGAEGTCVKDVNTWGLPHTRTGKGKHTGTRWLVRACAPRRGSRCRRHGQHRARACAPAAPRCPRSGAARPRGCARSARGRTQSGPRAAASRCGQWREQKEGRKEERAAARAARGRVSCTASYACVAAHAQRTGEACVEGVRPQRTGSFHAARSWRGCSPVSYPRTQPRTHTHTHTQHTAHTARTAAPRTRRSACQQRGAPRARLRFRATQRAASPARTPPSGAARAPRPPAWPPPPARRRPPRPRRRTRATATAAEVAEAAERHGRQRRRAAAAARHGRALAPEPLPPQQVWSVAGGAACGPL
jgi:hypothetical protein